MRDEKGMTEGEMVGWHHQLNGHEFEQALGVGDGQGSLMCDCPLLLMPSIFPRIRVIPMSQFFALGGQSIGFSASASVLPKNIFRVDFL